MVDRTPRDDVVVKRDRGPSIWLWLLLAAAVIIAAILIWAWIDDDEDDEDVDTVPADGVETVVEDGAFTTRLHELEVAGIKVMVA